MPENFSFQNNCWIGIPTQKMQYQSIKNLALMRGFPFLFFVDSLCGHGKNLLAIVIYISGLLGGVKTFFIVLYNNNLNRNLQ